MARKLKATPPRSSIADIMPPEVVEEATRTVKVTERPQPYNLPQRTSEEGAPQIEPALATTSLQRTGEHSDIQKLYRLTPSAYKTLQQLSMTFSTHLGFNVPNSAVMRSVLYAIGQVMPKIEQIASEQLQARKQPSTAIGRETERDLLEKELTRIIVAGFVR